MKFIRVLFFRGKLLALFFNAPYNLACNSFRSELAFLQLMFFQGVKVTLLIGSFLNIFIASEFGTSLPQFAHTDDEAPTCDKTFV